MRQLFWTHCAVWTMARRMKTVSTAVQRGGHHWRVRLTLADGAMISCNGCRDANAGAWRHAGQRYRAGSRASAALQRRKRSGAGPAVSNATSEAQPKPAGRSVKAVGCGSLAQTEAIKPKII
jgi:hypothetical protein